MELWAWGSNNYGQLGLGVKNEQFEYPKKIDLPSSIFGVQRLGTGGGHTLILDESGKVFSTGWNIKGQLGLGTDDVSKSVFSRVEQPDDVSKVFCGWDHSVVLTRCGKVYSCGSNAFGQLGRDETVRSLSNFEQIPALRNRVIVDVACGLRHTLFLDQTGQVFVCGSSRKGQLGLGQSVPPIVHEPTLIMGIPKISHVCAGQNFSVLGLFSSTEIICFGDNKYGQFGTPSAVTGVVVYSPLKVKLQHSNLSCGWTHTAALLDDGTLKMFGRNCYGQLGKDKGTAVTQTQIDDHQFVKVSAGYEHVLAMDRGGNLYSWGWNEHGNCGRGSTSESELPGCVSFESPLKVTQCFAGSGHSFALLNKISDKDFG